MEKRWLWLRKEVIVSGESDSKRRLNIALCIGVLESEFCYGICEGALKAAKEIDANLFVLPGGILDLSDKSVEEKTIRYHYQYNVLYSLPNVQTFDAVIIEYGVITSLLEPDKKKEFLAGFGDVPKLLLAGREDGYHSITIDNKTGIRQAIRHLVEQHHCTRVGFVSGPLTNQDAIERLQEFRESVRLFGLDDAESLIAYGDFTQYHPETTEELIQKNPGIEAILFANDQMAVGGYQAVRNLDLVPGKDILLIGFDDLALAMMVEPSLTSVKVDIKEMAYMAVKSCPDLVEGKDVDITVPSRLVLRESCGCNNADVVKQITAQMFRLQQEEAISYLADELMEKYVNGIYEQSVREEIREQLVHYFSYYLGLVQEDGSIRRESKELEKEYRSYEQIYIQGYIELDVLFMINQVLYRYLRPGVRDVESCLWLIEKVSLMSENVARNINTLRLMNDERNKVFEAVVTNIMGDMLEQHSFGEAVSYDSVIRKLQQVNNVSSYLYGYKRGVHYSDYREWEMPKTLYVKAYHNRDEVGLYMESGRKLKFEQIFQNKYLPSDRRFDMLVLPLFSNDIQYGLALMETELELFRYLQQITCQIGATIEVFSIIRQQNDLKRELEKNLEQTVEKNKLLDEMSRLDPMTGVTNRRGFFNLAEELLHNNKNVGKRAIALYADMDSLKNINDEYGHDDGDFAIKAIATVLSDSFRSSDVVGRMGGDEFAAMALVEKEGDGELLKERIQQSMKRFNDSSEKPYCVNLSVGVFEFMILEDMDIEEVLRRADEKLYCEKKNKVKQVYKKTL